MGDRAAERVRALGVDRWGMRTIIPQPQAASQHVVALVSEALHLDGLNRGGAARRAFLDYLPEKL